MYFCSHEGVLKKILATPSDATTSSLHRQTYPQLHDKQQYIGAYMSLERRDSWPPPTNKARVIVTMFPHTYLPTCHQYARTNKLVHGRLLPLPHWPATPLPPFNESSTPATLADIWMHFTADCHLPHKMLECIGSFVMFEASHSLLSNVYTLLTFYLYQLTSKIICYCHKTFF